MIHAVPAWLAPTTTILLIKISCLHSKFTLLVYHLPLAFTRGGTIISAFFIKNNSPFILFSSLMNFMSIFLDFFQILFVKILTLW
ncbi:hypothetical protein AZK09_09730, partial [Streptococcus pneumoniae]